MTRNQIVIAVVAVLVLFVAAGVYYLFAPSPSDAVPATAAAATGPGYTLTADDHALGSPKAKVVIIEYAAPTCPHCAHFNETTFPLVKQNYIDTGKVYYVFRVFPLHPSDGAAEAMARCLPKDRYFEFIDLLFRNQPKWDWEYRVTDIHAGLVQMGRIAGMSEAQVDQCIGNQAVIDQVNKVAQDGQTRYGISSTPSFVINGALYTGVDVGAWPDMQKKLDGLLARK